MPPETYEDFSVGMPHSPFPWGWAIVACLTTVLMALGIVVWFALPPAGFQSGAQINVPEGSTVYTIAREAKADGLVRSSHLLYGVLVLLHDHKSIYAGTYTFAEPTSVLGVAKQLISRQVAPVLVKITIPEGSTNAAAANIAHAALPDLSTSTYEALASSSTGYLFPDTYLVAPDYTAAKLIALQKENFNKQTASLHLEFASSSLSEQEVVILASLIEHEANTATSMKFVAGILENRLKLGMPLQVDASVAYAARKSATELTTDDLKIDSPYNTYQNKGLPPTPIDNPGLMAIDAVFNPTPSQYLYYITDHNGVFHYAKTLDEHNTNVALYLKK